MGYRADQIRSKLGRGGINMAELKFLLQTASDKGRRKFATAMNGTMNFATESEFTLRDGTPVDFKYIRSCIDALGILRFCVLNDWAAEMAEDFLVSTKPKEPKQTEDHSIHKELTLEPDFQDILRTMFKFDRKYEVQY